LSVGILVADQICAPIERVPKAGELILTDELRLSTGGCASNAAVDLVRVGVEVDVVGSVGDDAFGRFIIDRLDRDGVGTRLIRTLSGVGTSGTMIVNVRGEDRRFIHTLGANAHFRASDIPWSEVRRAKVLYVGGYLLMSALDGRELGEVFRQARDAGVQTALDIVVPAGLDHWSRLEPVLPHTDVFLPNNDEAKLITGLDDPRRQAERFVAAGAKTAVITCGGEGTYLLSGDLRLKAGIFPMSFVGATGAGDAFDAGYITGLIRGLDPRGCLSWGSVLGASCVRSISATESVFTHDEAEAYLREHSLTFEAW
jgi:sugar/nucleoside kinase (ribokinase family)